MSVVKNSYIAVHTRLHVDLLIEARLCRKLCFHYSMKRSTKLTMTAARDGTQISLGS